MSRNTEPHSPAWNAQVCISFILAFGAMLGGIWFLPDDAWTKGYMFMGLLFTVGSTMNLAKTVRDMHEAGKVHSVIHDARLEKLLAEHDPLK